MASEDQSNDSSHQAQSSRQGPTPPGRPTVTQPDAKVPSSMPSRIGQYHLKRVIASGGMGTVYEAVQEQPRRTVAVKVMKEGITSRSALRRFEYEAQLLARLRHPGIAQVYEAGTHDDGTGSVPYFAMEYIPNPRTITEYARAKKLGTRDRLQLFMQVCEAVYHGHQKGIIHRDLKPANILVDSHGQVKIIDFGVARATDSDMAVTTLQTDVGQLIGTVQYMSPEQCEADPHDLDTRSDVYSLGVVLYELLCEHLPYDVTRVAVYEAARVIREQPPTKLSTLSRTLRGDVETIVLKALEKDRERRYQSPNQLRQDIDHYLAGEPISARPPSMIYQLRVFARRNKPLVGGTVAVIVVLLAGIIVSGVLYAQAKEAQAQAAREAQTANAINRFFQDMLASVDPLKFKMPTGMASGRPGALPGDRPAPQVRVADLLRRASEGISESFAGQPELEAAVRHTIGTTFAGMGMLAEGEQQLRAAFETRCRILGEDHPDTLRAKADLGNAMWMNDRHSEGEAVLRSALERLRRVLGDEHPDTLAAATFLASALFSTAQFDEAGSILRDTLERQRRVLGSEHADTLQTMCWLSLMLGIQGNASEAEAIAREARRISRRVLGPNDFRTAYATSMVGCWAGAQGKFSESERLLREALAVARSTLGDGHPCTVEVSDMLVQVLRTQGKLDAVREEMRLRIEREGRVVADPGASPQVLNSYAWLLLTCEPPDLRDPAAALPVARRAVERSNYKNPAILDTLAMAYLMTGDIDRAIETQTKAVDLLSPQELAASWELAGRLVKFLLRKGDVARARQTAEALIGTLRDEFGSESEVLAVPLNNMAVCLMDAGRYDAAEPLVREGLALARTFADDRPASKMKLANTLNNLAIVLYNQGKRDEAEPLYREAVALWRDILGDKQAADLRLAVALNNLAMVLHEQGKYDEVEVLYREALAHRCKLQGDDHPEAIDVKNNLAILFHQIGDPAAAEELYREILAVRGESSAAEDPKVTNALNSYASLLNDIGDPDAAMTLARENLEIARAQSPQAGAEVAGALVVLGDVLTAKGDPAAAEPLLRECLKIRQRVLREGNWLTANAESILGECLGQLGRFEEAEPLVLKGYGTLKSVQGESFVRTVEALERVIQLYEAWGKPDQAGEYRAMLPQSPAP